MIEKLKYWFWKRLYLSHFKYGSPTRYVADLRIFTVYDLEFKKGGMEAVKKEHNNHLNKIKALIAESK